MPNLHTKYSMKHQALSRDPRQASTFNANYKEMPYQSCAAYQETSFYGEDSQAQTMRTLLYYQFLSKSGW
eukprot:Gb_29685 [translate_table: standard]